VVLHGSWLNRTAYERFLKSEQPDQVLARFPQATAQVLMAGSLETGFDVFFEALRQRGRVVEVEGKDLEVAFDVVMKRAEGQEYFQPVFIVRKTRLRPQGAPGQQGGPGAPGPMPQGLPGLPFPPG
jgi:hypothetical protein